MTTTGKYGCILCDQPPPHSHQLQVILNSRYYCPDGEEHAWVTRRFWLWFRRASQCARCDMKQAK